MEQPSPVLLSGKEVAKEIRQKCAEDIAALTARYGMLPGLAIVRVGDDPASVNYAERIVTTFGKAGVTVEVHALPGSASRAMLQAELTLLNGLRQIAGIIVQMPLPPYMAIDTIIDVLDPGKDVDGIHPDNVGRLALGLDGFVPATPCGGVAILDHYNVPVEGRHAVVVGRSSVVGKPLAQLLLARNATVTVAHSRTRNLSDVVRQADIVASAVGKPLFVKGDWLKEGAIVLDFGAAEIDGKMTGDVDFESALPHVAAITPVPGGTGPVTNAILLRNTIKAIKRNLG